MPIPKPATPLELDKAYVTKYVRNFLRRMHRMPPIAEYVGKCVACGRNGHLGWDLIHQGELRTTNLFCYPRCKEAGGDSESHKEGADRQALAPKSRVSRVRSGAVGSGRRKRP